MSTTSVEGTGFFISSVPAGVGLGLLSLWFLKEGKMINKCYQVESCGMRVILSEEMFEEIGEAWFYSKQESLKQELKAAFQDTLETVLPL